MNLTLIAEVLVGETMIAPGGAVDRETAVADDVALWQDWMTGVVDAEEVAVPEGDRTPVMAAPSAHL